MREGIRYCTMGQKQVLSAKVGERTLDRLEQYAEQEGISRSNAADRMIKQGLDVQESDMRLVPIRADGLGPVEEVENEVKNLQSNVVQIDSQLDRLDDLDDHVQQSARLNLFLILSVVWVGTYVSIGMPDIVLLLTGPALTIGLFYQLAKSQGWF